jgi:lipoprotein-releasing system permease protein
MSFESFVARRYLKIKHQKRLVPVITILATLGVAVGVMVLVVVIAVMSGFQSELKARILGIDAHMLIMRYNQWIDNQAQLIPALETIEGITTVSPYISAQGILRASDGVSGVVLRGIDPERTTMQINLTGSQSLTQLLGQTPAVNSGSGVVLGTVLAEKLKVKAGDGIVLMVSGTQTDALRRLPKMHRLKVRGLFETGMHQYDGVMGFIAIRDLQELMGVGNLVTGINIRLENADDVDVIAQKILGQLGFQFWVTHWKQMHRNLFSMLALQKVMMYIILTLIIVVAAFNIASALIMMVREKTRDIAILKVMGATHKSLWKIFLGKGLAIGVSGIGLGLLAGLALCALLSTYPFIELPGDVYFLTTMPVEIRMLDMGIITLGTLIVCVFASWYPAQKASKLNPVDAIRYG